MGNAVAAIHSHVPGSSVGNDQTPRVIVVQEAPQKTSSASQKGQPPVEETKEESPSHASLVIRRRRDTSTYHRESVDFTRLTRSRVTSSFADPMVIDKVLELGNNTRTSVNGAPGVSVLARNVLQVIFEDAFDVDHRGWVDRGQFLAALTGRPDIVPFLASALEWHKGHDGVRTAEDIFRQLEAHNHHEYITFPEFLAYFALPVRHHQGCIAATSLDHAALCSNAHWSYEDPATGPARWHTLSEKNRVAAEGKAQSPIDIHTFALDRVTLSEETLPPVVAPPSAVVDEPPVPLLDYSALETEATIVNTGYTVQVGCARGRLRLGGAAAAAAAGSEEFRLQQFHFHAPAEHTVDGTRAALELHLVHVGPAPEHRLAVVGVLFRLGPRPHPFLAQFWDCLPPPPAAGEEEEKEADGGGGGGAAEAEGEDHAPRPLPRPLDLALLGLTEEGGGGEGKKEGGLLRRMRPHYAYEGSLTTPPCSEGVAWRVLEAVQECSADQLAQYQAAVGHQRTYRPTQPLHGRRVALCCRGHGHGGGGGGGGGGPNWTLLSP